MKKMGVFLLLCIPSLLFAQHILQSKLNMFRVGDEIVKQQVNYKDPGRSGENVLWDFSLLDVENEEYEISYVSRRNSMITGSEHLTHYHYTLRNDSLLLLGFDNQTTHLVNHQPELLFKFPVNYGSKDSSYFYGHGKYGNRLEMNVMGIISTQADAYGMMILPNKDTLRHVLRTHTIKYIAEETQPLRNSYFHKVQFPPSISKDSIDIRLSNDSVLFVVETFRWYERGYRYPVFETVRSWEQYKEQDHRDFLNTAFFYPPQEHYYLEYDEANLSLLEEKKEEDIPQIDPWEGLTYNIYPNPVRWEPLEIELYLPKDAEIKIQIRNPMGLLEVNENKGFYSEGICHFTIPFHHLAVGNYVLDIQLNEKVISEIIMKR